MQSWVLGTGLPLCFVYAQLTASIGPSLQVRGPFLPAYLRGSMHWTEPLLSKLTDSVKLARSRSLLTRLQGILPAVRSLAVHVTHLCWLQPRCLADIPQPCSGCETILAPHPLLIPSTPSHARRSAQP